MFPSSYLSVSSISEHLYLLVEYNKTFYKIHKLEGKGFWLICTYQLGPPQELWKQNCQWYSCNPEWKCLKSQEKDLSSKISNLDCQNWELQVIHSYCRKQQLLGHNCSFPPVPPVLDHKVWTPPSEFMEFLLSTEKP